MKKIVSGLIFLAFSSCTAEYVVKNNTSSKIHINLDNQGYFLNIGDSVSHKNNKSIFEPTDEKSVGIDGIFNGPVSNYISGSVETKIVRSKKFTIKMGETVEVSITDEGGLLVFSNNTPEMIYTKISLSSDNFLNSKFNNMDIKKSNFISNTFLQGNYSIQLIGLGVAGTNKTINNLAITKGKISVLSVYSNSHDYVNL